MRLVTANTISIALTLLGASEFGTRALAQSVVDERWHWKFGIRCVEPRGFDEFVATGCTIWMRDSKGTVNEVHISVVRNGESLFGMRVGIEAGWSWFFGNDRFAEIMSNAMVEELRLLSRRIEFERALNLWRRHFSASADDF